MPEQELQAEIRELEVSLKTLKFDQIELNIDIEAIELG